MVVEAKKEEVRADSSKIEDKISRVIKLLVKAKEEVQQCQKMNDLPQSKSN